MKSHKFWGANPTFAEVMSEKLEGRTFIAIVDGGVIIVLLI